MLNMIDVEFIRKKHLVDGWSIRKLSDKLAISRQVVRKCLASADPPRYQLTSVRPSSVAGSFQEVIRAWLEQDEQAPPKQRHTAKRIYQRLREEYTFKGAESIRLRRTIWWLSCVPERTRPLFPSRPPGGSKLRWTGGRP